MGEAAFFVGIDGFDGYDDSIVGAYLQKFRNQLAYNMTVLDAARIVGGVAKIPSDFLVGAVSPRSGGLGGVAGGVANAISSPIKSSIESRLIHSRVECSASAGRCSLY